MIRQRPTSEPQPQFTSAVEAFVKDWNLFIRGAAFINEADRSKLLLPAAEGAVLDIRV